MKLIKPATPMVETVEIDARGLRNLWSKLRNPNPKRELHTLEFAGRTTYSRCMVELTEFEVIMVGRGHPRVLFGNMIYHGFRFIHEVSPCIWEASVDHIEEVLIGET